MLHSPAEAVLPPTPNPPHQDGGWFSWSLLGGGSHVVYSSEDCPLLGSTNAPRRPQGNLAQGRRQVTSVFREGLLPGGCPITIQHQYINQQDDIPGHTACAHVLLERRHQLACDEPKGQAHWSKAWVESMGRNHVRTSVTLERLCVADRTLGVPVTENNGHFEKWSGALGQLVNMIK